MKHSKPSSAGSSMKALLTNRFRQLFALVTLWLAASGYAQAATLSAVPDRTQMFANETLVLTVKYENGNSNNAPDFSPLKQSFDILGQNQSSQYVNTNGRVSSSVQWVLTLAPKSSGKLLVPPLSLDGVQSKPATIEVKAASAQPKGSEVVFIETSVDKQSVYVQEEFIVSLKLHFRENIIDANAEDFVVPNAEIVELNRSQYQTTLVHTPYQVIHLRFAVKPQASGTLEIPSYLWTLRTSASANRFAASRSTLHRLRTDALSIEVKPKPASYPAHAPWLPAKALNLSESWSQNPPQFTEGEPITRNITITARGLTGEQLPPLKLDDGQGAFKYYPDQPAINSDHDDRGTTGSRQESYALVPNQGGTLTLPAITVTWWDTTTDQLRTAQLPAREINVAPAKASSPSESAAKTAVLPESFQDKKPEVSPAPSQAVTVVANPYWQWATIASLLLNFALIAVAVSLWLRLKAAPLQAVAQAVQTQVSLGSAIKAAQANQAHATYSQLQLWLKQHNAGADVLTGFKRLGAGDNLLSAVQELDRSLYGPSTSASDWRGNALAEALKSFKPAATKASSALKLYPSAA